MFVWDEGCRLLKGNIALDFTRRQPCGFISHAHSDHIARHQMAICTPETSTLYQFRLGPRDVTELPYFSPLGWAGLQLTTYPAGHCLGSAMLHAEDLETHQTLLFTGDFKLGASATSVSAVFPPHVDSLILESTFGDPQYHFPPREEVVAKMLRLVQDTLESGKTPVFLAYNLGKSQELTKIFTAAGHKVVQHSAIYDISQIYERHGVSLGDVIVFSDTMRVQDAVLVVPPYTARFFRTGGCVHKPVFFVATGWAATDSAKFQYRVDHAIPLSDHADYDDLLEAIRLTSPQTVYCVHGPHTFVDRLLDLGIHAKTFDPAWQPRLF